MANSIEEFKKLVEDIKSQSWYKEPIAFGIARVDRGLLSNQVLQAVYPVANWNENPGSSAVFLNAIKNAGENLDTTKSEQVFDISDIFLTSCIESFKVFIPDAKTQNHKNVELISTLASLPIDSGLSAEDFKVVFIFKDKKVKSVEAAYLKLYAKNSKKVKAPNLDGIEELLVNCAWIDNRPIELDWLRQNEILLKVGNKYPNIDYVGKYPRFLNHIIPQNNQSSLKEPLLK